MNQSTSPTSRFILNQLKSGCIDKNIKILDYGCGHGALVRALRENGYDAFGADIDDFWEEKIADFTDRELFDQQRIKIIQNDSTVDFPKYYFDVLICDMVVEHVVDKDCLFKAMRNLLKPGGVIYFFFPVKEGIREAHIKQFFIHWLPKGKIRYMIAIVQRKLNIGKDNSGMPADEYVKMKLDGIDSNTHYEWYATTRRRLEKLFKIEEIEADFITQRLAEKGMGLLISLVKIPILKVIINSAFRIYSFAVLRAVVK
jgi:SAM-dependent methyltransferase